MMYNLPSMENAVEAVMDENVIANDSKMLVLYKNIKKQLGSTGLSQSSRLAVAIQAHLSVSETFYSGV